MDATTTTSAASARPTPPWQAWLIRHSWWVGLAIAGALLGIRSLQLAGPYYQASPWDNITLATLAGMPPLWMFVVHLIAVNPFTARTQFKHHYQELSYVLIVFWLLSLLGVMLCFYWTYLGQVRMHSISVAARHSQPWALDAVDNDLSSSWPLFGVGLLLAMSIFPLLQPPMPLALRGREDKPIKVRRVSS